MSYASAHMSLMDIQKDVAHRIRRVSIISELDLTVEDFHYIAAKIKMLFKFPNDNSIVDDYKLIIVTYWVYSMVYEDSKSIDMLFEGLPQYKRKYYFQVCMEAFDEYGIDRFDLNIERNLRDARALIARHAGIPPTDYAILFNTISEYQNCAVVDDIVEAVMSRLPKKSREILNCYTDEMRRNMVMVVRSFMIKSLNSDEPREIILRTRGCLTVGISEAILDWCDSYESQNARLS
ncbi:MAG: hypothetical protein K5656_04830 [Lachnospiraceae bacterium]|nr:hypothetical protein [Lachnospiraceae bacterium]